MMTLDDKPTPTQQYQMKAFFTASLPLPPGLNRSYKPGSAEHPIVGTPALHQFKKDAALLLSQGYHDWDVILALRKTIRKTPLKMDIHFFHKDMWKRPDIDACLKAVIDAVFARLELDDVLVTDLHPIIWVDAQRPRVDIEVYCDIRG